MKRIIAVFLSVLTVLSFAACGKKADNSAADATEATELSQSVGNVLLKDFEERAKAGDDAAAIAEGLLENDVIKFMGGTMEVEPGFLTGFGNTEITGFEEGVMFSPMIGTIPFVGYVFTLGEDADKDAFIASLEEAADLRWNICTEADEMVTGSFENKVFFVMCPESVDEAE